MDRLRVSSQGGIQLVGRDVAESLPTVNLLYNSAVFAHAIFWWKHHIYAWVQHEKTNVFGAGLMHFKLPKVEKLAGIVADEVIPAGATGQVMVKGFLTSDDKSFYTAADDISGILLPDGE